MNGRAMKTQRPRKQERYRPGKAAAWMGPDSPQMASGPPAPTEQLLKVKGNVRVRTGNGTQYPKIGTAHDELLPYLGQAEDPPNWYQTEYAGQEGYITSNPRYTEVIEK